MKLNELKISRTTWALLVMGIFLVGLASLGMTYGVQQDEQSQLNDELLQAQLRLKRLHLEELAAERQELEEQLSQAQAQLEDIKVMVMQPLASIDADDVVLDIAVKHNVKVIEITSSGLASDSGAKIPSNVLPLTLRVEGNTPSLIGFIAALQEYYTASAVKSIDINFPAAGSGDNVSARVLMSIQSYEVK